MVLMVMAGNDENGNSEQLKEEAVRKTCKQDPSTDSLIPLKPLMIAALDQMKRFPRPLILLIMKPTCAGFVSVSSHRNILLACFFFFDTYISRVKSDSGSAQGDVSRFPNTNDNGFLGNLNSFGNQPSAKEESMSFSTASEQSRLVDPRLEGSKKPMGSVTALKELCMMEGLGVPFQAQPPSSSNPLQKDEVYADVCRYCVVSPCTVSPQLFHVHPALFRPDTSDLTQFEYSAGCLPIGAEHIPVGIGEWYFEWGYIEG
ncbi:putative double-stranded RNA binding protein [Corchorus capsularis]|uniref:Putative double-stranded RNA binding protein n=1 Tax=Corchorus capsularis TaxID=210143 RepID=A0A1R3JFN9_COCAP|nr:putative double-stranded RNA binding protein [Corchorus capsularis]